MNSFMTVKEVHEATGISPGLLYDWVNKKKVESKTGEDGVLNVSLDSVKAHRKAAPIRRRGPNKVKALAAPEKRKPVHARPATKQADHLTKVAMVLEIFYPGGIPVKQYVNALLCARAFEAVAP